MNTMQSQKDSYGRSGVRVFAVCALLLGAPLLRAENKISVGYGEGQPGSTGVQVIITASNDAPIHAYSLALSFPADVLEARSFDVNGTHVAVLEPEFVAPKIDNELGVATLGVILNYDADLQSTALESTLPEEARRIIARIVFDVKPDARGGTHEIKLSDGIGQPAVFNRFSDAGASIEPALESGSFFVEGGNYLCLDRKIAIAGASPNVTVFAFALHPEALSGFQIAFQYDCTALTLNEAVYEGTDVGLELGNLGKVEFFLTDIDDTIGAGLCRSRTGVIFDYVEPYDGQKLSPSTENVYDQTLMAYRFNVDATADDAKQYQSLYLDTRSGDINNAFLIGSTSLDPNLIDGKIYFSTGSVTGRVIDKVTGSPVPGVRVTTDPEGYQVTTSSDGSYQIDDVIPGDYSVRLTRSGHYKQIVNGLQAHGANGTEDWGTMGIYKIPSTRVTFRRAFVNADRRADISDTVWYLNWMFKGGEQPTCLLAADINNDNRNDISDAIFLLNFLFTGGTPPPEPWTQCGTDEDSNLTCEFTLSCE